ncbi:unnamed protein product [Urochloa humidicola]
MPSSALPRGAHAVLVTSGHLRHLDPHIQAPPLLLANSLIAAFSRAALPRLALPLLRRLLAGAHPLRPDGFTFPPLFRAAQGPATAAQLHACALRLGLLHPSVFASGSLVHAYLLRDVVFDKMPQPDVPAWNAMLSGLCRNARAADAVALFVRMVGEGLAGDAVTLSSVLPVCVILGDRALALVMHVYAVKHGPLSINVPRSAAPYSITQYHFAPWSPHFQNSEKRCSQHACHSAMGSQANLLFFTWTRDGLNYSYQSLQ